MRLDPNEPIIVVSVEVVGDNGSRWMDMALDTGATYMMISWEAAEALGYDPAVSRRRIRLATASSVEVAPLITLKVVRSLGNQVSGVEAACHDLPPGSRVQGLLGLSFLKHFDVDIHFKRGILEARDS